MKSCECVYYELYSIYNICYTLAVAKLETARQELLLQRRASLLQQLLSLGGLINGSSFERFSTCARTGCSCHKGERHGPRLYVTTTHGKKQKQHYVPQGQRMAVLNGIRQYGSLLEIVERIAAINLTLMRGGVLNVH